MRDGNYGRYRKYRRDRTGGKSGPERSNPLGGGGFVIEVAFRAGEEAFCAERLETFVELATGAAEIRIVFVAEGENRIAESFEARREIGVQRFEEIDGVVRCITIAPGTGDEEEA